MKNGNLPFYRLPGTTLPTVTGSDVVICETSDGKLWRVDNGGNAELVTTLNISEKVSESISTAILNLVFPIGSIYSAFDPNNPTEAAVSPASRFPGTIWARIAGRILVGAGTSDATYTAGATGGASRVSLSTDEMPNHDHRGIYWALNSKLIKASGTGTTGNGIAITANTSNDGTYTIYTATNGSSASHENMPPYYVVYMWRRTA